MKPIPLLTPYKMGEFQLSHRVVLAPLSRLRSYGGVPQPHAAVYYSQRATPGGFLISEATLVSGLPQGRQESSSFRDVPGIWAQEHVDAWRPVVDAVHAKGAVFFCQLWHVGDRVVVRPQQVSPQMSFDGRREELSSPRRVTAEEAPRVVDWFRRAARNAVDAGFDGVEILGANGYFVDDGHVGSAGLESRCRFALEVVDAVAREVGGHRMGVCLDQFTTTGTGTGEEHAVALHVVSRLNDHGVLYCHMIEPRIEGRRHVSRQLLPFREAFDGTFIANGGYGREEGDAAVGEGYADLVAYGRLFLANPDLPRRFELAAPLNDCNRATFYGAGDTDTAVGYTDYPFLDRVM
ncbi:putative 12-oxophytodienoate reductase 2 [Lolium rigidum]|uniref:putative 12-oxophytodienoate reductase 2 n=1 Tax=Lolium rigidum TaxID=89674 RepID=UPI001F5D2866|nr:putative 12-oxophytodienoate reductase 2 [Lolium rigidum]